MQGWMLLAALAFYGCIALFYFREAVFTERVQICSDTILNTYPWVLERPSDFKPRNFDLSDQCTVFYPWFHYTAQQLRNGDIPLWTPHVLGGVPYMGNLSTAIFYPLNLLIAVLPLNTFFLIQSLLKVIAAGLFTYLLLRKLGLGFPYALFGGGVYACSGFTILWVISHLTSVAVLLPALLLATEIFVEKRNGLSFALISGLLGLQFLGAQPETSLCVTAAWGIYTVCRIRRDSGLWSRQGGLQLVYLGAAGLIGTGLVLFQLWPFLEYMLYPSTGYLNRQEALEVGAALGVPNPFFTPGGLGLAILLIAAAFFALWISRRGVKPLTALLSGILAGAGLWVCLKIALMIGLKPHFLIQVFPDLYGNPLGGVRTAGGAAYPEFNGGYAGSLAFLLALIGGVACRKRAPVGVLGALFILSFGAVHGVPLVHHLVKALPLFDMCPPGRMLCVTAFSVATLSAFGLEAVIRRLAEHPGRLRAGLKVLGASAVLAVPAMLSGIGFVEPVVMSGEGGDNASSAEASAVLLTVPEPGHTFQANEGLFVEGLFVEGLFIEGKAGPGINRLSFYLDGIKIGSLTPPEGGEGFPRPFRFPEDRGRTIDLDRTPEGLYSLMVRYETEPSPSSKGHQGGFSVPVRVLHQKSITTRNLVLFLVSVAALILLFVRFLPGRARIVLALAVMLTDLALVLEPYNCTTEPDLIFPDNPITDFLTSQDGIHRVLPENSILQPSTNYMYDIQIIRGYDGLEIPEYNRIINMMKRDPWVNVHGYNSRTLIYDHPFLDVLGVRFVVSQDDLGGIPGFRIVLDGPVKIFENTESMPRAFVVGHWINISGMPVNDQVKAMAYIRSAIEAKGVDPEALGPTEEVFLNRVIKEWAFLEKDIPLKGGGSGRVDIESYENERVLLKVSMEGEGILILTDNYFPGWKVLVDGVEREMLRSLAFRAVPLEDGEHSVEFVYHPQSFYLGIKIAIACLGLVVLFMFIPFLTAPLRRRGPVPGSLDKGGSPK